MDSSTAIESGRCKNHADFDKLAAGMRRKAYHIACRMTGNPEDAKDLVQDAYLRAYSAFDKYNPALPFENWLCRILTNLCIDWLRYRRPQPVSLYRTLSDDESASGSAMEFADHRANPERLLLDQVLEERLQQALTALPEAYRRAVVMCDVEERPYKEIAGSTGCSLGTVRSRIHRGRLLLRRSLDAPHIP